MHFGVLLTQFWLNLKALERDLEGFWSVFGCVAFGRSGLFSTPIVCLNILFTKGGGRQRWCPPEGIRLNKCIQSKRMTMKKFLRFKKPEMPLHIMKIKLTQSIVRSQSKIICSKRQQDTYRKIPAIQPPRLR